MRPDPSHHLGRASARRQMTRAARLALVAAVPGTAYAIDWLLGGPLPPQHGGGLTVGDLAARLTPAGLHQALVLGSWLAWLAGALTVVPLVVPRRAPRPLAVGTGGSRPWDGASPRNHFEGPTHRQVVEAWPSTAPFPRDEQADGTISDPFAWGDRFDDPDPWRELGPAEAGMTTQDIDGGAAASDGGAERRWWRGADAAKTRPRRLRQSPFGKRRAPLPPDDRPTPDERWALLPADDRPTPEEPAVACRADEEPAADELADDCSTVPSVLALVGEEPVDLLTVGSVALAGDAEDVAELLCSMVVDVVSGPAPQAAALLVGFGHEMHALDPVTVVEDEAAALAFARAALSAGAAGAATVGAAIGPPRPEALIVFVGHRTDVAALDELVKLAAGRPPADEADRDDGDVRGARFAVVVAGELAAARWRLCASGAPLAESLSEQDDAPVAASPAASTDEPARGTVAPIRPGRDDTARAPGAQGQSPTSEAAGPVEVGILGRVRVSGTPAPFDRKPRLTELVVYLALHPDGATTDAWATALWPDRRMPASTQANRLSETRIALGVARDGYAHLRKTGGRHHLGPEVSTDWDCFQALAAKSDPEAWREALALVRGRPFEGLREPQWTVLEGTAASIVSAVVELACRLAEQMLATSDADGAEWAARRAMLCCPWDERLTRVLMRAADAAGNRAGVEAALRQLAKVLEADGDPLAAVHPETSALYRALMARREAL
jgi:DNA-binding SARP family transcriptional activator